MTLKTKYRVILSQDVSKTKEEAIKITPKFKAMIRDKALKSTSLTLESLKNKILEGYSINLGCPKTKHLLAIDIDNKGKTKISPDRLIELLGRIKAYPALIFASLGHTEDTPKMRVIIALDKPIDGKYPYEEALKSIADYLNLYYPDSTDSSPCLCSSVFYPCKQLLYQNLAAVGSFEEVMALTSLIRPTSVFQVDYQNFMIDVLVKYGLDRTVLEQLKNPGSYFYFYNSRTQTPNLVLYLENKKILSSEAEKYRELKSGFLKILFESGKSLTSLYTPVFQKTIHVNDYMYNQIDLGVAQLYFRFLPENSKSVFSDNNNLTGKVMVSNTGKQNYIVFNKLTSKKVCTLSLIDVFKKLTNSSTNSDAIRRLYEICNIEVNIKKASARKRNLNNYKNGLKKYLGEFKYLNSLLSYKDNNCTLNILHGIIELFNDLENKIIDKHGDIDHPILQVPITRKNLKNRLNLNLNFTTIGAKINLLIYLGLINRISPNLFNEFTLKVIFSFKMPNPETTLVVSIPKYSKDLLKQANLAAKEFIDSNKSLDGLRVNGNPKKLAQSSVYFKLIDEYIKSRLSNGDKFILQTDLVHFLKDTYKDYSSHKAAGIITKYKDALAANNCLKTTAFTPLMAKKFKITKEQMKLNNYRFNCTNILIKEG